MQTANIQITGQTPIGAIPLDIFKEQILSICTDFLREYIELKSDQEDRGKIIKGMKPVLKALGFGKEIFYEEWKAGNLDGVVRQNGSNTSYYGYEKELQDKGAEISARRQAERRNK